MKNISRIPMDIRAVYLSMHRITNATLGCLGITADQFVCLGVLYDNGTLIQSQIVKLMTSDPNTVSAILKLLERKGYISKVPHPRDSRAKSITITAEGESIFNESCEKLEPIHQKMASDFSVVEIETLSDLLSRYFSIFQHEEENPKSSFDMVS